LITVRKAKEEIKRLQFYINLVEDYEADTLEKLIIKEYAFENSSGYNQKTKSSRRRSSGFSSYV
jgi:hypothetical protein